MIVTRSEGLPSIGCEKTLALESLLCAFLLLPVVYGVRSHFPHVYCFLVRRFAIQEYASTENALQGDLPRVERASPSICQSCTIVRFGSSRQLREAPSLGTTWIFSPLLLLPQPILHLEPAHDALQFSLPPVCAGLSSSRFQAQTLLSLLPLSPKSSRSTISPFLFSPRSSTLLCSPKTPGKWVFINDYNNQCFAHGFPPLPS